MKNTSTFQTKEETKEEKLVRSIKERIRINHFIMESNFNNLNLINIFIRWRIHLIAILVIALLGSAIVSSPLIITPKFKSWAVIYPANISPYSEESETEQMYQILQASYIRDMVIAKFELDKHYEISPDYKYYKTTLINEYNENVKISKTSGEAIRIEVFDKDPVVAKEMVEAIIEGYNAKIKMLHEEKFGEVVAMWGRALMRKQAVLDSLEKTLNKLATEDGLIDYQAQSTEVVKGLLGTVEGGSTRINIREVNALREKIQEKGGLLMLTLENLEQESVNLRELTKEYDIAYSNYDRQYTYTNLIESPFVSDKKSYPVRWLIVVLTMFTALFLALIIIGVIENLKIKKVA